MSEQLTTLALAVMVKQMRHAQKSYFTAIAKAKKSKSPEEFAIANSILKTSKQHEVLVDTIIQQLYYTHKIEGEISHA